MGMLETMELDKVDQALTKEAAHQAVLSLEQGRVLYFPTLAFSLQNQEMAFLSPSIVDPRSKNISFDLHTDGLRGTLCQNEEADLLKAMLRRYAVFSRKLIEQVLPAYIPHLKQARTSFRPVEALGRITSYRKDDTRLHVDAFPANPVRGRRILRVFTNVNPEGKPRVWRIGEPFADVARTFLPAISGPVPGLAQLLYALKITKAPRSAYDHYMLKLHDTMKGDTAYQNAAKQEEVRFPPGATWIVFSDQVSHAAMSGQHLFEQTFYLPPEGLQHSEHSPLKILERLLNRPLL